MSVLSVFRVVLMWFLTSNKL